MKAPKEAHAWWDAWDKKHPNDKINRPAMLKAREIFRSEHAALALSVGYMKFKPEVHTEVWDFFLKKDPTKSFEDFATADTSTHDRALFLPRNGYKSTANIVDVVQTIITWPDITILIITGKESLGRDFIGEVRGHFTRNDDGDPKTINGEPSLFQMAFPEFCIEDKRGGKDSFLCPARTATNIKEDTLQFAGVETSQSGPHFDIIIFDDAVTNENSKTATRLLTVRDQIAYHRKMLNPYGYCTYIGTWYSPQDHYGYLIRAEEENKTLFWEKGKADSRDVEGRQCLTKILLRPAMWEKGILTIDIDGPLEEKDWHLWFPERLSWKWLIKERGSNRQLFHSQLMNNPNRSASSRFTREILTRSTRVFTEIPDVHGGNGRVVQAWDTAYSDSSLANYTVGFTILILGGKWYVIDMLRGQFSDFEIARVIAENMAKWRPHQVVMEEANGVRWLAREIRREQERLNFYVPIEFSQIEQNRKNRKSVLAAPVAKMFGENRIILSNKIPFLDKLYDEFEGFQAGSPNDDMVDAMSLAVNHFQYAPEASYEALKASISEETERRRARMQYEHFLNPRPGGASGGYENQTENRSTDELPPWVVADPTSAFWG